jgi:hypothetical protein
MIFEALSARIFHARFSVEKIVEDLATLGQGSGSLQFVNREGLAKIPYKLFSLSATGHRGANFVIPVPFC